MANKYTTSELIGYLDKIYYLVDGEGLEDEKDKPKYEEIKNRLLELEKIKKA